MANVIEIALTLQDRMSDGLSKASGAVGSFASKLAPITGGLGGFAAIAVTAGVAASNMARQLAEQVEQLDNLSSSSGVSAENLQILQFAFKQGGVDSGALTQGLNFMTRAIENNQAMLADIGVTSRDSFTAFQQLATVLANTEDVAKRNALAFQVFGRGAGQIIPIMENLAVNFDGVATAAEKSGNVLSEIDLETMRELDRQFDALLASVEGFGKRVAVVVAGPLVDLINGLGKLPEALEKSKGLFDRLLNSPRSMFPNGAMPMAVGPDQNKFGIAGPGNAEGIAEHQRLVEMAEIRKKMAKEADDQRKAMLEASQQAQRLFANGPGALGFSIMGSQDASLGVGLKGQSPLLQKMGIGNLVEEVSLVLDEAGQKFLEFSDKVEASFQVIGDHVRSGFYGVLTNLTNRMQTFSSAGKLIWDSFVNGVIDAMARLVSSAITSGFLKLLGLALTALTGSPVFAMAGSATSKGYGPIPTGGDITFAPGGGDMSMAPTSGLSGTGVSPLAMTGRPGGGGDTYYIQTINAKDWLQAQTSPTGQGRAANSRMLEVAAVS